MNEPALPSIYVAGDATVDWMLIVPDEREVIHPSYLWQARSSFDLTVRAGGATLLRDVLRLACAPGARAAGPATVAGVEPPRETITDPQSARATHNFSVWREYPARPDSKEKTWRVRDFLGYRPASESDTTVHLGPGSASPTCLVMDDYNRDARDNPSAWPQALRDPTRPPAQVILRAANPLAQGKLWEHLVQHFADRLTVYCWVADLRREGAIIGQPLSWERSAAEMVAAVRSRPELAKARRVVVALGMSGAVIVTRDRHARLIFDPEHQEGDWERPRPGTPLGLGTCIAAALAVECVRNAEAPDWERGVGQGLRTARAVHERGYLLDAAPPAGLRFPVETAAAVLGAEEEGHGFAAATVEPEEHGRPWQISSQRIYAEPNPPGAAALAYDFVAGLARGGDAEVRRKIPVEKVGRWVSIDRTEIEGMRSVRNIMREYIDRPSGSQPLNLAVFGPPGSGKSFGIKQMALEWIKDDKAILDFNVSQFTAATDVAAALQHVRDRAVRDTLPLVFWDEFDATRDAHRLGWLASFLAPMQDGIFVEGGVARPIGPAIFIFAGGTCQSMAEFEATAAQVSGAKATDFISRLRGFVDVLGPNQVAGQPSSAATGACPVCGEGMRPPVGALGAVSVDSTYTLRRALLLRGLLQKHAPRLFSGDELHIDAGVLRAFLTVGRYKHGARSMEAIIMMSALHGRPLFERSALPARDQLNLHVDADDFLQQVRDTPAFAPPE